MSFSSFGQCTWAVPPEVGAERERVLVGPLCSSVDWEIKQLVLVRAGVWPLTKDRAKEKCAD